jgi:hypothetical protein
MQFFVLSIVGFVPQFPVMGGTSHPPAHIGTLLKRHPAYR